MSTRKPCPICGAVRNYALRRVIVPVEQALSCAPQMEEWYLVGYAFLRKPLPDVGGRESRTDGENSPEYRSRDALEPIVIVDLQGRVVDLSDEVVRTYGWTRDDLPDQPLAKMAPRTDHRLLEERLEQCRKGETLRSIECRSVDKSGREHKGPLTLSLLTDERGAPERSP